MAILFQERTIRPRWRFANPTTPDSQVCSFRYAQIEQPLLRHAKRVFAVEVEYWPMFHRQSSKRLSSRHRASDSVGHPRLATATFAGEKVDAADWNDAFDEPLNRLLQPPDRGQLGAVA